ncbi:MAG: DUF2807 domain-containing protein [Actinomycetota bacterium]|nr:DUF2807 domain-containing protein [Actinomycetota bacterium]
MRTNAAFLVGWTMLAGVFGAGCAGNAGSEAQAGTEGGEDRAKLNISGGSGKEFSGSCAVGGEEPEEIGGQVPQSFAYDLEGRPLKCEIASEGDLHVTLTHGNTRSAQRIGGGTLNLAYENGSVSSSTSSSSVSSSSTSSQVSSSSGATDEEPADATDGSAAGTVASETRDVSGFDEVELSGVGNLSIRQTGTESLSVTAEEDVLPKIRTEVVDGRLIVGPEPNASIETTEPIDYELTVGDLHALEVSGSGDVDARGIQTEKLATTVSGSGAVEISGKTESQQVNVSGTGGYEAEDLESKEAKVDVEGAGSAVVNASEELDAKVGGTGSVEYVGDPTVDQDVSGIGRVSEH